MKPFHVVLLLTVLALLPVLVTDLQAQGTTPTTPSTATPTATTAVTATVSSRATTLNGRPVGEVLIGDAVVLRIRESAGGYSPGQRANIVASRLSTFVSQGYGWEDVTVGEVNNESVLLMGERLLVTADVDHARLNATTPTRLAADWRGNLQTALRTGTVAVVAGTTEQQWPDWTNATTRIVPILAAGTPGVSLGAAQITGPRERVEDVRAVLQLDLVFQRAARIRVFVPSSELTGLNRVQGVAVSALLQYRLFEF